MSKDPHSEKQNNIPAVNDVYWVDFCRPLCVFILKKDRGWPEVKEWSKSRKINGYFIRNALAWLEGRGYVCTYLPLGVETNIGSWVWRVSDKNKATTYVNPTDSK